MARPAFKRRWARFVPRPVERSTYVLLASLILMLLFWQWRPVAGVVWGVENTIGRHALWALFFLGWAAVLVGTPLSDHFDLFGLRQVNLYRRGEGYTEVGFKAPSLCKVVRRPIMSGLIVASWAAPRRTVGRLVFALATTAYILAAIGLGGRDIVSIHGTAYEEYRKQVSMLLPIPKKR
jgi:protein-S-isoprenylcysteine O-methyltransferase Ste14